LLNLNLDLSLLHSLRPCWTGFFTILSRTFVVPMNFA